MRPPFARTAPGKGIRESLGGEMDPASLDKNMLEAEMTQALVGFFDAQRGRIAAELEPQVPEDRKKVNLSVDFWRKEAQALLGILLRLITGGAEGGVGVLRSAVEATGIGVDWTLAFTQAADWARAHAADLVDDITGTTRERVRAQIANWIETPEHTLPDLWQALAQDHAFSRSRAEMIAVTETTRAYAEGEMLTAREMERAGYFEYEKQWQTAMDNKVCPICAPLQYDGTNGVQGVDGVFHTDVGDLLGPPAHPRCRCWLNLVPSVPE